MGSLNESGTYYGMCMNVEKNSGNENLKAVIPSRDYDSSKQV
jgi:hypothetical protein